MISRNTATMAALFIASASIFAQVGQAQSGQKPVSTTAASSAT